MTPKAMMTLYDVPFLERFRPFEERLLKAGTGELLIRNFRHAFYRFLAGESGQLPESLLTPLEALPDADAIEESDYALGAAHLQETVVVKLNGGLGTGMGMEHAKSLLKVKDDLTFLDIIARQALRQRVPLLLMNSFATHRETLSALRPYKELLQPVPHFMQHQVPKINAQDYTPAVCAERPELEWYPPGHGDFFLAIAASGALDRLIDGGFRYLFVSNADNLGAVLDPGILGWFIRRELDFLMEAAERTPADRKGGHLALMNDRLILRESAQCPEEDRPFFQDISRHRFFNTNNLWINLSSLKRLLQENDYLLPLPLIANRKNLDPIDKNSPPIIQLETAMGAAISVFAKSAALRVPRRRFIPVKNTADLLVVRSDVYQLSSDFHLLPHPEVEALPIVQLDPAHYKFIRDFEKRFPYGAPSLAKCRRLSVQGDVVWGKNIRLEGDVTVINASARTYRLANGLLLNGVVELR